MMRSSAIFLTLLIPTYAGAQDCGFYAYRAKIERVVDGDTVVLDIDQGLRTYRDNEWLRLFGIDAPEMVGLTRTAGEAARAWLTTRLGDDELVLCTIADRRDSFGRYLGVLFDDMGNVNEALVEAGHAVPYRPTMERPD
jgi:micrococcal nuclease